MKKYYLILVIALISFNNADAQVKFGLEGGLDLSSISLDGALTDNLSSSNRAGFFVGPMIDIKIPIIQLGVDAAVLYNQKQLEVDGESGQAHYINIPINAKIGFGLGDLASIYFATGPQFAFSVGNSSLFDELKDGTTFSLSSSQFSWNVGAGVKLLKHLQVGYNYNIAFGATGEFNGMDAAAKAIKGELKNNSHQISVAYLF